MLNEKNVEERDPQNQILRESFTVLEVIKNLMDNYQNPQMPNLSSLNNQNLNLSFEMMENQLFKEIMDLYFLKQNQTEKRI